MTNEKNNFKNNEQGFDSESLQQLGSERNRELAAERESTTHENGPERNVEHARQEALEHASKAEKESRKTEKNHEHSSAERRGPASKREREISYKATMSEVHSQMSAPSRLFSEVIHHPVVEKVSDAVGGTIARPNAILSGSVSAFLLTLAVYLVARFNGYPLSGAETIASFIFGWLLGLIYDYLRILLLGKK